MICSLSKFNANLDANIIFTGLFKFNFNILLTVFFLDEQANQTTPISFFGPLGPINPVEEIP